jgi:hypothetical protein
VWGRSGEVLLHVRYLCDALGGGNGLGGLPLADTWSFSPLLSLLAVRPGDLPRVRNPVRGRLVVSCWGDGASAATLDVEEVARKIRTVSWFCLHSKSDSEMTPPRCQIQLCTHSESM